MAKFCNVGECMKPPGHSGTHTKMVTRTGRALAAFKKGTDRYYTGKKTIGIKGQRAWNAGGPMTARRKQWWEL